MYSKNIKNEMLGSEQIKQYNNLSAEYASLAEIDPAKKFVQYPEALNLLGDIVGKKILDIGCGNGLFTRMLARRGAEVVGYDPSIEQIKEAQKSEGKENLGIRYFVGDRPAISPKFKFDKVASVMVLMYANDKNDLQNIFSQAYQALKDEDSQFCSITFNPDYKRFDQVAYNRRFIKNGNDKIQVDFLDEKGDIKISAKFSDFSVSDYEDAAREAGFERVEWVKLKIAPEGKNEQGEKFWRDFEDDSPYIGIKAFKN